MPTQNRRVATYLPPHIDEPFKSFKSQRDIKGDSEALIVILSEYFQVSQEVAYPSSSNLLQRIEAIEERLGSLKSELLGEFKNLVPETQKTEPISSSKDKLPGKPKDLQLQTVSLFPEESQSSLLNEPKSKLPVDVLEKPKCPRCGSEHIRKNGSAEGYQKYRCVDCSKFFRGSVIKRKDSD
jgi:predicted RNA-binding Zn-ribbon protein involved in translation (DUF1610 family)